MCWECRGAWCVESGILKVAHMIIMTRSICLYALGNTVNIFASYGSLEIDTKTAMTYRDLLVMDIPELKYQIKFNFQ